MDDITMGVPAAVVAIDVALIKAPDTSLSLAFNEK